MKTKILSAFLLLIFLPVGQALACPFFLFGAVMSVLGGIGAFSFHLWRHGRMPAEPHQEITEEDLSKYE